MAPKAEGQDPASGPRLEVLYPTGTGSSGWPEADDGTKGWRDRILLVAGFAQLGQALAGGLNSPDGWSQTVVYSSIPAHRFSSTLPRSSLLR